MRALAVLLVAALLEHGLGRVGRPPARALVLLRVALVVVVVVQAELVVVAKDWLFVLVAILVVLAVEEGGHALVVLLGRKVVEQVVLLEADVVVARDFLDLVELLDDFLLLEVLEPLELLLLLLLFRLLALLALFTLDLAPVVHATDGSDETLARATRMRDDLAARALLEAEVVLGLEAVRGAVLARVVLQHGSALAVVDCAVRVRLDVRVHGQLLLLVAALALGLVDPAEVEDIVSQKLFVLVQLVLLLEVLVERVLLGARQLADSLFLLCLPLGILALLSLGLCLVLAL